MTGEKRLPRRPNPKAMILAAGRGTRLRPLTDHTPKPLLEVQGQPLIAHQIEQLKKADITEIVINLHHLGSQIADFLEDGKRFGVSIEYSREPELLETGGGIVHALPLLGNSPFWLLNGDIFTDFNFNSLPDTPPLGSQMHLVVTPTPSFRERGDFTYASGRITGRGTDYVYCGIAVVDPAVLGGYGVAPFSLRDVMFDAIDSARLTATRFTGAWTDIGTLEQLEAAQAGGQSTKPL